MDESLEERIQALKHQLYRSGRMKCVSSVALLCLLLFYLAYLLQADNDEFGHSDESAFSGIMFFVLLVQFYHAISGAIDLISADSNSDLSTYRRASLINAFAFFLVVAEIGALALGLSISGSTIEKVFLSTGIVKSSLFDGVCDLLSFRSANKLKKTDEAAPLLNLSVNQK